MTSNEVPSVATCGSSDWTSVSSMIFRVPPAAVPAAEEAVELAAEEAATELDEPPQTKRSPLQPYSGLRERILFCVIDSAALADDVDLDLSLIHI